MSGCGYEYTFKQTDRDKKTAPTVFLKKDTDLERFYFWFTENHEFSNRLFFDGTYRSLYCFFGI